MRSIFWQSAVAAIVLSAGLAGPSSATMAAFDIAVQADDSEFSAARRGGGALDTAGP